MVKTVVAPPIAACMQIQNMQTVKLMFKGMTSICCEIHWLVAVYCICSHGLSIESWKSCVKCVHIFMINADAAAVMLHHPKTNATQTPSILRNIQLNPVDPITPNASR